MDDLILGFALLAGLAGALFVLGCWLGRTRPIWLTNLVALGTIAGLAAYALTLWDNVLLAEILPVSNLIVVGNWFPLGLSLLAGLAWSLIPRLEPGTVLPDPSTDRPAARRAARVIQVRRLVAVLSLQAVGWYAVVRPLWGSPPPCRDQWQGDICVQTSAKSCAAACAVTLLRMHGIAASESEMAELCLTRRGTTWQGLYRGLKLKTAGTPWDVAVVHGSFDDLRSLGPGPAILAAGLPNHSRVPRIYTERYGWSPGDWHSVLFFGFRGGGLVAMGEPTPGVGRENWTEEDLRVLWRGRGVRLVPRQ